MTDAAFAKGDVVALAPRAQKPFLAGGACTTQELERLSVVALGTSKTGAPTLKLRTATHQSVGWIPVEAVTLVSRAP